MGYIDLLNDIDGKHEVVHGSDGRANVDSRSAERIYHISRTDSEAYAFVWDDANATAADFVAYLKNDDTQGRDLVVHSIGINCEDTEAIFKLHTVTGTQAGGASITPTCLNRARTKTASATAASPADSSSTPMTGLTSDGEMDMAGINDAYGHEEFRIQDAVRLGQGKAIGIELDFSTNANVRAFGVIFFYFEKVK